VEGLLVVLLARPLRRTVLPRLPLFIHSNAKLAGNLPQLVAVALAAIPEPPAL
jgi:hypothetical protein